MENGHVEYMIVKVVVVMLLATEIGGFYGLYVCLFACLVQGGMSVKWTGHAEISSEI